MYRAKMGVHQFTIPSMHAMGRRCAHWIGRPHNRGGSATYPAHEVLWVPVGRGTVMFQTPTPLHRPRWGVGHMPGP